MDEDVDEVKYGRGNFKLLWRISGSVWLRLLKPCVTFDWTLEYNFAKNKEYIICPLSSAGEQIISWSIQTGASDFFEQWACKFLMRKKDWVEKSQPVSGNHKGLMKIMFSSLISLCLYEIPIDFLSVCRVNWLKTETSKLGQTDFSLVSINDKVTHI